MKIDSDKKVVSLSTDVRNFYYMYITKINYDLRLDLTKGEIKTLAEIMYEYYKRREYNIDDIDKLVFNKDNRKNIINQLNTTVHTFNNSLTSLRSARGLAGPPLTKSGLNRDYLAFPDKNFQLIFNFNLTDTNGNREKMEQASVNEEG